MARLRSVSFCCFRLSVWVHYSCLRIYRRETLGWLKACSRYMLLQRRPHHLLLRVCNDGLECRPDVVQHVAGHHGPSFVQKRQPGSLSSRSARRNSGRDVVTSSREKWLVLCARPALSNPPSKESSQGRQDVALPATTFATALRGNIRSPRHSAPCGKHFKCCGVVVVLKGSVDQVGRQSPSGIPQRRYHKYHRPRQQTKS